MAALEVRLEENLANTPNVVTLNVGGTTFQTSKSTLLRVEGSYFHALLGSGLWQPDSSHGKAYFLDLDPDIFRHVLNFLRTGKMFKGGPIKHRLDEVRAMTEYLNLDMGDCWNQWNPNALPPSISSYNDGRTIECSSEDGVAFAMLPLGSIRIRLDRIPIASYYNCKPISEAITIGAGPTTGSRAWSVRYSRVVRESGRTSIVTICRRQSHVDIALNDGPPISIEIEDPSEQLFPAVSIRKHSKLTILAS